MHVCCGGSGASTGQFERDHTRAMPAALDTSALNEHREPTIHATRDASAVNNASKYTSGHQLDTTASSRRHEQPVVTCSIGSSEPMSGRDVMQLVQLPQKLHQQR